MKDFGAVDFIWKAGLDSSRSVGHATVSRSDTTGSSSDTANNKSDTASSNGDAASGKSDTMNSKSDATNDEIITRSDLEVVRVAKRARMTYKRRCGLPRAAGMQDTTITTQTAVLLGTALGGEPADEVPDSVVPDVMVQGTNKVDCDLDKVIVYKERKGEERAS
ncbi:hypothetical protein O9K51_11008 [Purpureocillium lavendulum]|uniref:Uncharacterized protein n=1 Tax=Purpureocillium lavendulum TaxID=1247861 RepID=A0AB34FCJ8_9HYPO|nr:hypothetical protein O9K51_11008 [Purpureocillium lavendulum]